MAEGDETIPPASGEVDTPMRVVVCSTRARLVCEGDAVIALDVAELLMALDEPRRVTVLVESQFTSIELGFFARLAR
ncbi:MAG TPA: hypothetical protein VL382_09740, partial [Terriglobales bacterium]|nr:hypothetical protein [Terriglobales bacterium]